ARSAAGRGGPDRRARSLVPPRPRGCRLLPLLRARPHRILARELWGSLPALRSDRASALLGAAAARASLRQAERGAAALRDHRIGEARRAAGARRGAPVARPGDGRARTRRRALGGRAGAVPAPRRAPLRAALARSHGGALAPARRSGSAR